MTGIPSAEDFRARPLDTSGNPTDGALRVRAFAERFARDQADWADPVVVATLLENLDSVPRVVCDEFPQVLARGAGGMKGHYGEARQRFCVMLWERLFGEFADAHAASESERTETQNNIVKKSFWEFCHNRFRDQVRGESQKNRRQRDLRERNPHRVPTPTADIPPEDVGFSLDDLTSRVETKLRQTKSARAADRLLRVYRTFIGGIMDAPSIAKALGVSDDQAKSWRTQVVKIMKRTLDNMLVGRTR